MNDDQYKKEYENLLRDNFRLATENTELRKEIKRLQSLLIRNGIP